MRRLAVVTGTVALVVTGVAMAASYKSGTYSAGNPSTKAAGITLTVRKGSFSVQAMSFHERCVAGHSAITDYFEFVGSALLCALALSSLGMLAAARIRKLEDFAVAMNFVIFPLFFFSGALYPAELLRRLGGAGAWAPCRPSSRRRASRCRPRSRRRCFPQHQ